MKQYDKLVSVIICCYKNYNVLGRAVQSVLIQDYPRIELYIADDHSDFFNEYSLLKMIEKEKGENLESVIIRRNPINLGTVKNIKSAVESIKGDFYITLGADDAFFSETVISDFMSVCQVHPDAQWMCGKAAMTSPDLKTIYRYFPEADDIPFLEERNAENLFSRWCRKSFVVTPAMCFKKGLMDQVGGYDDKSYRYMEDWPLILRLLRKGIMPYYINTVVLSHSMNGISNNNGENGIKIRKTFLEEKYHMFRTEVDPYIDRLTAIDQAEYRAYMNYWMDRIYFLQFLLPNTNAKQKIFLFKEDKRRLKWFLRLKSKAWIDKINALIKMSFQLIILFFLVWLTFVVITWSGLDQQNILLGFVKLASGLLGIGIVILFVLYYLGVLFLKAYGRFRK